MPALSPADVLQSLDLDRPGLERVKAAASVGNRQEALRQLVAYYRNRSSILFEEEAPVQAAPEVIQAGDDAIRHVFALGMGYPPQNYGPVVDWSSDPVHDIEWVAGMERFYWQRPLIAAYRATHQEKYAQAWMDLTRDWIAKHPVDPPAFDWLDIQVGIRATNLCAAFSSVRQSPSITGEFLAIFLASLHDHAEKSALFPRLSAHNKAILEAMGLIRVAVLFPEFRDAQRWLQRSYEVFDIALTAQLNPEGVQMEWAPNYHMVVASEMARVLELCVRNHHQPPQHLLDLTRKSFDFWLGMTAPDHTLPMFGDTTRDIHHRPDYSAARVAADLFQQPDYALLAQPDFRRAPNLGNRAFPEAGMFFLRSGWSPDALYMGLQNSPPALSRHDQPDNGTFELYAFGQWLMPDSGSYAYDNTPHANEREWFRQTRVHQTLTLDEKNSVNASKTLLWKDLPGQGAVVCFENASYPSLAHRRTVFFVDQRYFVLVDEAIGDAKGAVDLHFQFAPGNLVQDGPHSVHTELGSAGNVAVWQAPDAAVAMTREEGFVSFQFNRKLERPALAFRSNSGAPFVYVTVILPYRDQPRPAVTARIEGTFHPGDLKLRLQVSEPSKTWTLSRDLQSKAATIQATHH